MEKQERYDTGKKQMKKERTKEWKGGLRMERIGREKYTEGKKRQMMRRSRKWAIKDSDLRERDSKRKEMK